MSSGSCTYLPIGGSRSCPTGVSDCNSLQFLAKMLSVKLLSSLRLEERTTEEGRKETDLPQKQPYAREMSDQIWQYKAKDWRREEMDTYIGKSGKLFSCRRHIGRDCGRRRAEETSHTLKVAMEWRLSKRVRDAPPSVQVLRNLYQSTLLRKPEYPIRQSAKNELFTLAALPRNYSKSLLANSKFTE